MARCGLFSRPRARTDTYIVSVGAQTLTQRERERRLARAWRSEKLNDHPVPRTASENTPNLALGLPMHLPQRPRCVDGGNSCLRKFEFAKPSDALVDNALDHLRLAHRDSLGSNDQLDDQ